MASKDRKNAITRQERDFALFETKEWRPIPGHPDYVASKCGYVARVTPAKTHATPRILKHAVNEKGYSRVRLYTGGKKKSESVHRLVLFAWIGLPEGNKRYACHNDGNPSNNHLDNLRWDTCKGNLADRRIHGTEITADRNGRAKLTWEQVRAMRADYAKGNESYRSLSIKYDVAISQTREIIKKESWWPDAKK